jgi:hypothetical protein
MSNSNKTTRSVPRLEDIIMNSIVQRTLDGEGEVIHSPSLNWIMRDRLIKLYNFKNSQIQQAFDNAFMFFDARLDDIMNNYGGYMDELRDPRNKKRSRYSGFNYTDDYGQSLVEQWRADLVDVYRRNIDNIVERACRNDLLMFYDVRAEGLRRLEMRMVDVQ